MKNLQSTAAVALITAAIGLSAVAPSTAQETPAPAAPAAQQQMMPGNGPKGDMPRHAGQGRNGPRGLMGTIAFERGTQAVEIGLVRLSHAIDMTADQQNLFDKLKTDALAAAQKFTSTVEGLRPAAPADGQSAQRPDITKALDARIAIESAHVDALKAVQPSLTAFLDSLTDEQKAQLMPAHGPRMGMAGPMGKGGQHQRHDGPARNGHGPMGTKDGQNAAPTVAPTNNG